MIISFVSIQQKSDGWDIVKKTFPKLCGNSVVLSVNSISIHQQCVDQKIAEVTAKKLAELNKLPYVSHSESVITVCPFNGYYAPIQLTSNDEVICQGSLSSEIHSAIEEAKKVAEYKNLRFIFGS